MAPKSRPLSQDGSDSAVAPGALEDEAAALDAQALALEEEGQTDEALELLHRALGLREEIYGEESLACAISYSNLGNVFAAKADTVPQALLCHTKCLQIVSLKSSATSRTAAPPFSPPTNEFAGAGYSRPR